MMNGAFQMDKKYRARLSLDYIKFLSEPVDNQLKLMLAKSRNAKEKGIGPKVTTAVSESVKHLIKHTMKAFELIQQLEHDIHNGNPTNALSLLDVNTTATKYSLLKLAKTFHIDTSAFAVLKRKHRYNKILPEYPVSEEVQSLESPTLKRDEILKIAVEHGFEHIHWYDVRMLYKAMNWNKGLVSMTIPNSNFKHTVLCLSHADLSGLYEYYNLFLNGETPTVRGKYHSLCESLIKWEDEGWTLSFSAGEVKKGDMLLFAIWTNMNELVIKQTTEESKLFSAMVGEQAITTKISHTYPGSDSDVDASIKSPPSPGNEDDDDDQGSSGSEDEDNTTNYNAEDSDEEYDDK